MDIKESTAVEAEAPFLRFLNEDRCKKVHEATLELLERTGVWIGDPECLEMLSGAGARVVEKVAQKDSAYNTRVQIPAHLIEDAIHSAPESVTVYNRQGEAAMALAERNYYFGCHGDNPDFIDPYTQQRIKMGYSEIEMMTKLIDYLPNVNWVLSGANCYGRALEFQDRFCAEAILLEHEHTLKHFKDMWIPKLFDRTHFETLAKEFIVDSGQRAQQRAIEIIESHKPDPLSPGAMQDLAEVTKRWHEE